MKLFTFRTSNETFGIDVQYIYRIVDDAVVTPVPLTPPCYLGLFYYRGEVFDVIDVACLLEHDPEKPERKNDVLILVKWSDKKWALVPLETVGLERMGDRKNESVSDSDDNQSVKLIKPEDIWQKLQDLPYGPHKV